MRTCLAMCVQNHRETIARSIRSTRKWIQRYCLIDCGSSDGSIQIAQDALRGIEGKVYQNPWTDSGSSEETLIKIASFFGEYVLLIDPTEELLVQDPFGFGTLVKDCYFAISYQNGLQWKKPFLFRSAFNWQSKGPLTQDLISHEAISAQLLYRTHLSSLQNCAKKRLRSIEEALAKNPQDPTFLFYKAIYLEELNHNQALEAYEKRASLQGDIQELFFVRYRIAALKEKNGSLEDAIALYLQAFHTLETRAEPLYDLSERMIREGNFVLSYVLSEHALTIPLPQDPFFTKSWIYRYGLLHQFARSAFEMKRMKETYEALQKLVRIPEVPGDLKEAMKKNLELPIFESFR